MVEHDEMDKATRDKANIRLAAILGVFALAIYAGYLLLQVLT